MSTTSLDQPLPAEAPDGEPHPTIVAAPAETELTPLDLPGEPPTDRGYVTAAGTRLRARIVPIAVQETRAPTSGDVKVAPSGLSLSLTLAVLDETLAVVTDEDGALAIGDVHEIVWSDAAMGNDGFDPAAELDRILRQQAVVIETRMRNRVAVRSTLAAWGGVAPAPAS